MTEHTPAQIVQQLLVDEGAFIDPESSGVWPLHVNYLPDSPDNSASVEDTPGTRDRLIDGTMVLFYGVRLRVRGEDFHTGYAKIRDAVEELIIDSGKTVTISGTTYELSNISQQSQILSQGIEDGTKRRHEFSVEFLLQFTTSPSGLTSASASSSVTRHSPAHVLFSLLLRENTFGDPEVTTTWPLFVNFLPDSVDSCAAVFDTEGERDGRSMDGTAIFFYGIQLRVRGKDFATGYTKAQAAEAAIAAASGKLAAIADGALDYHYELFNISQQTQIIPLGIEPGSKRRHNFVINYLLTIFQSTRTPGLTLARVRRFLGEQVPGDLGIFSGHVWTRNAFEHFVPPPLTLDGYGIWRRLPEQVPSLSVMDGRFWTRTAIFQYLADLPMWRVRRILQEKYPHDPRVFEGRVLYRSPVLHYLADLPLSRVDRFHPEVLPAISVFEGKILRRTAVFKYLADLPRSRVERFMREQLPDFTELQGRMRSWFPKKDRFTPNQLTSLVGHWDFGATSFSNKHGLKGDISGFVASTNYAHRTDTTLPCVDGSGVPQYPLSIIMLVKLRSENVNTANQNLMSMGDKDGVESSGWIRLSWIGNGNSAVEIRHASVSPDSGPTNLDEWTWIIGVVRASNDRYIYWSTNPAGETRQQNAVTSTGFDTLKIGVDPTGAAAAGIGLEIGYLAILPVDLSDFSSSNLTKRQNIYDGYDPVLEAGFTYSDLTRDSDSAQGAVYLFDGDLNDAGPGGFHLTLVGSLTHTPDILVVRDQSGQGKHLVSRLSPPSFDATLFSNRGGAIFNREDHELMRCNSTPVTAAPFQIHAVCRADDVTQRHGVFFLGEENGRDHWTLTFAGDLASDPNEFEADDGTTGGVSKASKTGYLASTNYLLQAQELSSTSRTIDRNGNGAASDTSARTPVIPSGSVGRVAVGGRAGLLAPPAETPITIFGSKLKAWYRADLGVTEGSGGSITQWDDQSGNGHHLTGNNSPVRVTDLNGVQAIDFESADSDYFSRSIASGDTLPTDVPIVFYVVNSYESGGSERYLASIIASTGTLGNNRVSLGTSNAFHARLSSRGNGSGPTFDFTHRIPSNGNPATTRGPNVFYGGELTSTSRKLAKDQKAIETSTASRNAFNAALDTLTIGSRGPTTQTPHDGLIYEALVLNAEPTTAEHEAYMKYCKDQFKVANIEDGEDELDGAVGFVALQASSQDQRADMRTWVSSEFGITMG